MKQDPGDAGVRVTMHVLSRRSEEEIRKNKELYGLANATFKSLMQPMPTQRRIAARLSLPENVDIKWDVQIAARKKGVEAFEGHIPIMVSVSGQPGLMEQLNPQAVEEITDTIFREIRDTGPSKPFARALGYDIEKPHKFHMYLPHQVRVRGRAQGGGPPGTYGDGDGDGGDGGDGGDVVAWLEGGWSKGCSSWPW